MSASTEQLGVAFGEIAEQCNIIYGLLCEAIADPENMETKVLAARNLALSAGMVADHFSAQSEGVSRRGSMLNWMMPPIFHDYAKRKAESAGKAP